MLAACAPLLSCPAPAVNPLAGGLSEEQQALLIERTIEQIESAENFAPGDFEQRQRAHLEGVAEDTRDAALANLQRRLGKVEILGMSQTVEIDPESAEVDTRVDGPERVLALVVVTGERTFTTSNASQSSVTRFVLPWIITVERGKLVFHHQGIRMRDERG